jgi:cytochrome c-type protein NapC
MKKLFGWIRAWGAGPGSLLVLVFGALLGVATFAGGGSFMVYANSEPFCASACHEMGQLQKEHKGTIHDFNRSGVRATCNDCHVPHEYIPNYLAKVGLVSDLWGHFVTHEIDTKEKFEKQRYMLAVRVWKYMKANDSRECRHCHTTSKMEADKQSDKAKARHEKARQTGMTCIECHFAIAHNEPEGAGPQELFSKEPAKQAAR